MTSFFTLAGFASSLFQEPASCRLRQYAITAVMCGAAIKTVSSWLYICVWVKKMSNDWEWLYWPEEARRQESSRYQQAFPYGLWTRELWRSSWNTGWVGTRPSWCRCWRQLGYQASLARRRCCAPAWQGSHTGSASRWLFARTVFLDCCNCALPRPLPHLTGQGLGAVWLSPVSGWLTIVKVER